MPKINAFVTPPYPLLFSVASGSRSGVPSSEAELQLGLLIAGIPSFLGTHRVPEAALDDLVTSLQLGDPRVAVAGTWVRASRTPRGLLERRPAAFVSLLCTDGRRLAVARVLGEAPGTSPDALARQVVHQIARGVQVPDLAERQER